MIRRVVCFLSAVVILTSSVFAWDAYSFTGVYDVASASAPVMYSTSVDSDTVDYINLYEPGVVNFTVPYEVPGVLTYSYNLPMFGWQSMSDLIPSLSGFSPVNSVLPTGILIFNSSYTVPSNDDDHDYSSSSLSFPYPTVNSDFRTVITWDVSSLNSSCLEFSGTPSYYASVSSSGSSSIHYMGTVELYVDDTLVRTFYSNSGRSPSFDGYIYNGNNVVQSVSISFPQSEHASLSVSAGSVVSCSLITNAQNTAKITALTLDDVLDGFNDEAQDDINSHESIESQWTSSMSSNFDALDMDNFTFPSGLVSGFGLITGIFQDLWNAMGEYKILFVFPLTLGVALLLIGRISKFSGGQSSSRSNRGDDGA